MKESITLIALGLASSLFALSPPPEGFKEKPLEEIWEDSAEVLYGKVTALKLIEDSERERGYQITLRVEKRWKGEENEKRTFLADLPFGDGFGYYFQIGTTYAVFLSQDEGVLHPIHSMPIRIPAGELALLIENSTSDQPTGDGYKMKDKWKLRQFLKSKTPLTD